MKTRNYIIIDKEFKSIPGYGGMYSINSNGEIYSFYTNRFMTSYMNNGYKKVTLTNKKKKINISIHRLLMITFNGESSLHVNHKNGVKTDNRFINLEYVTCGDNVKHAHKQGLIKIKGEDNYCHKLTKDQVIRIKFIAKNIIPERGYWNKISKSLGVTSGVISNIINNRIWKSVII